MTPKISVIVPIYNAEKYLPKCLDSILAQTFTDFELLLINDGSFDNSGKICDEYAKEDDRIRVFHKENGGVSSARNVGLYNTKGIYSTHVDSDDWIEPNMLQDMYEKIVSDNSDIVMADHYCDDKYVKQKPGSLNPENIIDDILKYKIVSCIWNILVKNDLYLEHNISFCKTINYGEDAMILIELFSNNPKVSYLPQAWYHYSTHNEYSITRINNKEKCYNRIKFLSGLRSVLQKYHKNKSTDAFETKLRLDILYSELFSGEEYKLLFPANKYHYAWRQFGIKDFLFLKLAENGFYTFSFRLHKKLSNIKSCLKIIKFGL
ncbi:MAG: glycosyltransferase [Flavobacteriaceae bacterium]|jgi:glycosyltransferase involved in cell wall biosynthesis|nr:glycosyltransferase [Flavobacteriaceae bacterium]